MEITYELVAPLVYHEKWFHDTVRLSFKAKNQDLPIEVLGYIKPDQANDESTLEELLVELPESLKRKTILNTFNSIHFYYLHNGNEWVYKIPQTTN